MHQLMRRTVLVTVTEVLTLVWMDAPASQPGMPNPGGQGSASPQVRVVESVCVSSSVVVVAQARGAPPHE